MPDEKMPPGRGNFDGPQIAHWERHRWATFQAQVASSTGDAGVLGNFPQDIEQELIQKVEQLLELVAEKDAWSEALEEELQLKEQVIVNLNKELTWRDWGIGPPSPLRPPSPN